MTKHSLRPIAICVMLFGGLPVLAPQGLSAQTVGTVTQNSRGTVEGKAVDGKGKIVPNTQVRLRNVGTGQTVETKSTDAKGMFVFKAVEPGNYVVEVVNQDGQVVAASGLLALAPGAAVTATIAVPAAVGAASILGMSAPVAAIVMGSAAAAGILAVSSDDCVSPPCQ